MTLGVFLDLEKAFDMVWREGIIAKLSQLGIKGKMLRWINDFLQDRSMKVRVGATLSKAHIPLTHPWHSLRQRPKPLAVHRDA